MKKKDRLEKIRRFVSEFEIGTQEEIVEHLRESGITATQATVSRDIKELGKIPFKDNTYIYELPKTATNSLKLAENNILACQNLGNMLNLNLVPGSAAVVKRHLSKEFAEEIFSIIADNDSILIVAVSESAAQKVTAEINNW